MNIIVVTSASAPARTLTLDWRHALLAGTAALVLLAGLASGLHFATLKWAAATQLPWLRSLSAGEQREEARLTQQSVQGQIEALAVRLGDLQAQLMRLDGLGERLARAAGLQPSELAPLAAAVPARGGAAPRGELASATGALGSGLDALAIGVEARADHLRVLEALLFSTPAPRAFLPSLRPIAAGVPSSDFGFRIDPFTGQRAFHEGVDFAAETGTPIVTAASGRVVHAGWHPHYGRLLEIDHGNGLVSRYAHARELLVGVGDIVVRGQRVASVGSTGRSTGPHLHFEVRLNGIPQNPARFLASQ